MDNDLKNLLEEQLKISKESLEILKKLNRARQWSTFFMVTKWLIIIGLLIFGFITIQPYLESIIKTSSTAAETLKQLNDYYFPQQQ